jgi:hypothetical protein
VSARRAARVVLVLWCLEGALGLLLVGLYKAPVENWSRLSPSVAAMLVLGAATAIGAVWLLARLVRGSPDGRRALGLGVATHVLAWSLVAVLAETAAHVTARRTPQGVRIGGVWLRPTWRELADHSRELLLRGDNFFVYDADLGWSPGPSRCSRDGIYCSSAEGVRTAIPGARLLDEKPAHRVALLGDSNAFSLEVPFLESWGHHLQQMLGPEVQVLNFGVDGFGIDQFYLRYLRDVRPFAVDVVIVAFIEHDLSRTMTVYPVVSFGWPGYLVKPRFVLDGGELRVVNMPLPTPQEILDSPRVDELPHVEDDLVYRTTDWSWRFPHGPLVLRFLTSAFPRWPAAEPVEAAPATEELNARLLAALAERIGEDGAALVLVPLPRRESGAAVTRATAVRAELPFENVEPCLDEVPAEKRRVASGFHYSSLANEALARCVAPPVLHALVDPPTAEPARAGRRQG